MPQGIAILGSTGSIGCNALRVIENLSDDFKVVALAAGGNAAKLAEQIARHAPQVVSVAGESCARELNEILKRRDVRAPRIVIGESGLCEVALHREAEIVVSATVGVVGLVPTLRAVEQGKRIALANKETLVAAGQVVMNAAAKSGAKILPVDSEHNALHQCLRGERRSEIKRLILTASGGPFRTKTKFDIEQASVADAMNHPTWRMGAKITIDSATLMNKGLEVIEARWLFDIEADKISVIVHPESVVHSMIELIDNSIIAQMGATDMRHAIQYALTYPARKSGDLTTLDLTELAGLHFEKPDTDKFPCLRLAYEALRAGGTLAATMNAANEEAVKAFLDYRIKLSAIAEIVEAVMNNTSIEEADSLETVLRADTQARANARELVEHQKERKLEVGSQKSSA